MRAKPFVGPVRLWRQPQIDQGETTAAESIFVQQPPRLGPTRHHVHIEILAQHEG